MPPTARGAAPDAPPAGPAPLLYLHPRGHLNDLVVPAGALSAMNAAPFPKLGRYAFEVSDAELRAARVVAMDLHWALGLAGLEPLLARVRAVNPTARVVVGGITASHYPRELLDEVGVDHVVQGDAEAAFPALAAALLDGRDPGDVPNVWTRGRPPPRRARIDAAAFDAVDPLTADWFPTLSRVRDWPAAAFPMSATLPVARGCALRCPTCHGSHAAVSGEGVLAISPAALVRHLERARALGLRSLRLVVGKLPASRLAPLLAAAAARGPFPFPLGVGLYLCTPPDAGDLAALEAAFDAQVTVSVVPPGEHVPRPPDAAVAREEAAWREVAAAVARSRRLRLDVWAGSERDAAAARRALGDPGPRAVVSLAAVWSLTRPDAARRPTLAELRDALGPVWTFYAGRLLSPALEPLLAPFRLLDELDADPAAAPPPPPELAGWRERLLAHWRAHRIAALPGLSFDAVPARLRPSAAPARGFGGTRLRGALRAVASDAARLALDRAVPLAADLAHDAVRLRAPLRLDPGDDAVALVARPPPGGAAPGPALPAEGLVVLDARGAAHAAAVQVAIRVQEAEAALVDAAGTPLARGRAELGYVRPA